MKKLYQTSFFYLILGLIGGVFYREFTKFNNFNGITTLRVLHPHFLILGFLFFLILTLASFNLNLSQIKSFNKWYITYNIALLFTGITFLWRGILQVQGLDFKGLNHIAGLGHTVLGVSLIWFMIVLKKALEKVA